MKILYRFLFLWVIFALLDPDPIRNLNVDPDPATQINADPYGSGSETLDCGAGVLGIQIGLNPDPASKPWFRTRNQGFDERKL